MLWHKTPYQPEDNVLARLKNILDKVAKHHELQKDHKRYSRHYQSMQAKKKEKENKKRL